VIEIPAVPEPQAAVDRVRIIECHDPMVELTEAYPELRFRGRPHWLRRMVAEMLRRAHEHLPEGLHFYIIWGYRPLVQQQRLYWGVYDRMRREHPKWPRNILRRQTNRYVAPPDAKAPPGHSTGGAVDLGLVTSDGERLDMTSPYRWGDMRALATNARGISHEARRNRGIIIEALSAVGFSNCSAEFWHWSYGDSAWAVRTGRQTAIFGAARVPDFRPPE
jgi:D-alanyl-D-alanine dipeptidase